MSDANLDEDHRSFNFIINEFNNYFTNILDEKSILLFDSIEKIKENEKKTLFESNETDNYINIEENEDLFAEEKVVNNNFIQNTRPNLIQNIQNLPRNPILNRKGL